MTGVPVVETKGVCHYAYLDKIEFSPFVPEGEPFKINTYAVIVKMIYSRYDENKILIDKVTKETVLNRGDTPLTVSEYTALIASFVDGMQSVINTDKQELSGYVAS